MCTTCINNQKLCIFNQWMSTPKTWEGHSDKNRHKTYVTCFVNAINWVLKISMPQEFRLISYVNGTKTISSSTLFFGHNRRDGNEDSCVADISCPSQSGVCISVPWRCVKEVTSFLATC